ncbi:Dos2-interacting transcription regulator of RNA-Pol-II-domain-containing protein [Daldinia caldariorum]|uniref:Dos2-interacting transcription regulator of RNA-Pol-II-domain-containing protein n=1 Tax=Daldinia caldariorum TaxID=326644 RepID=UPI00200799BA|nr:Dos2-interacting transcription regulator of RNA-Pol-II-domain-containing protein [Daldinia caldariorum]KAI1467482.1 Dos2-interacting transcription regulator of RNA-Pol-II-domain-containing protein [Daldinia caldariorum]
MATVKFDDLALQYVLADENDQEQAISEKAATAIQESTNTRIAVGQWVASINRWIQPGDDSSDDNLITRAKALDFLASTLGILKKRDVSLTADQIKLLVTFFGSLFSSDHRAGVTASAKALKHLVSMKSFQPILGDDIIANICKLGDDFKLQAPATRLELYELFLGLLQDPAVANHLEYRHGSTCGFMTSLLDLCRNERDPQNLIKWFETLKIFLQNFSPSEDITLEVFKTFSAYFPISLRSSATPSGITADDLKSAVRSCFAAHYRLANHAIPYLVNKLDQGDAVTVTVKVDILQTLDACLVQYEHPKQSVVPFVDQIWSSLKYEVRNGEIPDTIKATLKVIRSLTARLDEDELRSFLASSWRDLVEDISSPTYTAQAGRLLVAISGAGPQSFSSITPQAISHIQYTLKHTQSTSHKQELVALLNSILTIRSHLVDTLKDNPDTNGSPNLLNDELFGDSLFSEVYAPLWKETSGAQVKEQGGVFKKTLEGLATLAGQRSSDTDSSRQLCSRSICEKIFNWLASPSIVYPLEGKQFNETNSEANQDIRDAAVTALKEAVPLYPPAFQLLLQQYLSSLKVAYQQQLALHELPLEIKLVAGTLCEVGASGSLEKRSLLSNSVSLINTLLKGLLWMLSVQAPIRYWTALICSIHFSIIQSLSSSSEQTLKSSQPRPYTITKEWHSQFVQSIENAGAPRLDLSKFGNPELVTQALEQPEIQDIDVHKILLSYSLSIVEQLYRRFTTVQYHSAENNGGSPQIGLSKDFKEGHDSSVEQDICLHQLGLLAASVVRALNGDEQKALNLSKNAFILFHNVDSDNADVSINLPSENIGVSPLDEFRTAPLSMGILQGLHPGVMDVEYHTNAMKNICTVLTTFPSPCSDTTRAALDIILTILSNKLRLEDENYSNAKLQIQQNLTDVLAKISSQDPGFSVRVFRSILHFLAGDVARFRSTPDTHNSLLKLVCEKAPSEPTVGRQLARNFEVLVSPKECLEKENHAIIKRLSGEWLYFKAVQPYLKDCFPNSGVDETVAVNRAVMVFAILKHLQYEQYASDIEQIVRIGIRSLSTFNTGLEMESCLHVLLQVLEKGPNALKEHLAGLISGMVTVYETARKEPKTTGPKEDATGARTKSKERVLCRKFALEFFQKLPNSYESQYLVPYRQQLLRPLSAACGDSVREIRRIALGARKAWEELA